MPGQLQSEIKQTKRFESLEHEAHLSIERTAAVLTHALGEAFKPHGITATQYNALRILRGAGDAGLCRGEVRDRLVSPVPDVTRLLDRLEHLRLIERERATGDRRLVNTRITREGLKLLAGLDATVGELHREQLGHMSPEDLQKLIDLLAVARRKP